MNETTTPRGRTRVASRALEHAARALTAETLHVEATAVKAELHDRAGELQLDVSSPIPLSTINSCRSADASIYHLGRDARETIAQRYREMTAHRVAVVNLVLTGIVDTHRNEPRVR